ncbi:MAG: hypothetical protein O7G85_17555 [Planctomycetota bacterium]|nr:hypothetical protein [Planctomycetota bacterium]
MARRLSDSGTRGRVFLYSIEMKMVILSTLLVMGLSASTVSAQCMYEYIPLPRVPDGPLTRTLTNQGIGEDDTIIGYLNFPLQVPGQWTLEDESLTILTLPDGFAQGQALGIYNSGASVGHVSFPNNGMRHPVFWRDGVPELLPRAHPDDFAFPLAINRHLHLVGWANGPGLKGEQGFIRPAIWIDGEYSEILNFPVGPNAGAEDINDRGEIVGWMGIGLSNNRSAFHWVDGVATDLGLFPNGASTKAVAINNLGLIVGSGFDTVLQDSRPLYWHRGVARLLPVPNDVRSGTAQDVNDGGQIVGMIQLINWEAQSCLWQQGQRYDLNKLLINDPGSFIGSARAINNRGVISVGVAVLVPIDSPREDVDHNCRVDVEDLLLMLG